MAIFEKASSWKVRESALKSAPWLSRKARGKRATGGTVIDIDARGSKETEKQDWSTTTRSSSKAYVGGKELGQLNTPLKGVEMKGERERTFASRPI